MSTAPRRIQDPPTATPPAAREPRPPSARDRRGLLDTIVVSNALVTAFALAVYFRDRKHGAPWLVV